MADHAVGNNPIDPVGTPHLETVSDPHGAHEEVDVNPRALFIFLAVLVVVVAVVMLLMWLLFDMFERRVAATDPEISPLASQRTPYTGVRLESSSTKDIDEMRRQQQEIITTYAWIDEQAGMVRVPLQAALQAAAENGLPEWQAAGETPSVPSNAADPAPDAPAQESTSP